MSKQKKEEQINSASQSDEVLTLKCARCGSKQIYTLATGTHVCRRCGFRE